MRMGAIVSESAENTPNIFHGGDAPRPDGMSSFAGYNRYSPRFRALGIMPFTTIAMSATLAPRVEIYTMLVCSVHKPDVIRDAFPPLSYRHSVPTSVQQSRSPQPIASWPDTPLAHATESVGLPFNEDKLSEWVGEDTEKSGNTCASDPVVQAEVAKLSLGNASIC